MSLVTLGPVLIPADGLVSATAAHMRSHTLATVKDLHRCRGRSEFHHLLHQWIRHAVEVGVEGDVIIDVDADPGPFAEIERRGRQRPECGLV